MSISLDTQITKARNEIGEDYISINKGDEIMVRILNNFKNNKITRNAWHQVYSYDFFDDEFIFKISKPNILKKIGSIGSIIPTEHYREINMQNDNNLIELLESCYSLGYSLKHMSIDIDPFYQYAFTMTMIYYFVLEMATINEQSKIIYQKIIKKGMNHLRYLIKMKIFTKNKYFYIKKKYYSVFWHLCEVVIHDKDHHMRMHKLRRNICMKEYFLNCNSDINHIIYIWNTLLLENIAKKELKKTHDYDFKQKTYGININAININDYFNIIEMEFT